MKELIGKIRKSEPHSPGKILINEHGISGKEEINEFNIFFKNIGPELVKKVSNASRPFEIYFKKVEATMPTDSLTINKIKEVFFYQKKCFSELL